MKVLFVASEMYPFAKTGGLGDVVYALPKMLRTLGVDARVIIPKYSKIAEEYKSNMIHIASYGVQVGWRNQYCGLQYLNYNELPVYFIDNEYYFKRDSFYGDFDDGERFAFFDRAVLESIRYMDDFVPDVIHCNDWQTGMIPLLLKAHYASQYWFVKTVYTIHNLKYQGIFSPDVLGELFCLDMSYYDEQKCKFNDSISMMKAAVQYADAVTTVSPTYAEEIQMAYYGEGLDGLLREKSYKLYGILNGLDYDVFNPAADSVIAQNFDAKSHKLKVNNKLALQQELGLPVSPDTPMISIVSRLVEQKGLDLVTRVMEELLQLDMQLVILGSGDLKYTDFFEYYAKEHPDKVHVYWGYSDALARKIYAGSDMFLMPSQFEPCGLGQLIAMRYGALPVVRETGGLKDTVQPYNQYTGEGTGFSFANYNAHEMLHVIEMAVGTYKNQKVWYNLVKRAMKADFSWKGSAQKYMEIYKNIT